MVSGTPQFQLRPASNSDFEFCWPLYRDLMKALTAELLGWNEAAQRATVEQSLGDNSTSVIAAEGSDIGWIQIRETEEKIYLGQLYLVPAMQNRGIGTAIVTALCTRASQEGRAVALDVMKNNRARFFYERLGFITVGSSAYKLNMEWRYAPSGS
jgi:ribosomal protein S18 acetylase RimI-like enzyme